MIRSWNINESVWRIHEIYYVRNIAFPKPRAFALRLIEEAVALCLACGASVADVRASVNDALRNEHEKDLSRSFTEERPESRIEVAKEIADVALLNATCALSADITAELVETAAAAKVDRLVEASRNDTLHFTKDGRIYRRPPPYVKAARLT